MDDQIDPRKTAKNLLLASATVLGGLGLWNATTGPTNANPQPLENRIEQERPSSQESALSVQDAYAQKLQEQLEAKKSRFKHSIADSTAALGEQLIDEYRSQQPTRLSLDDYISRMDQTIRDTDINWGQLAKTKFITKVGKDKDAKWVIDSQRIPLTKEIASSIDARQLLSYSLTELGSYSPEDQTAQARVRAAKNNVAELKKELAEGGIEYRNARMSQWDKIMSYGMCQITGPAVQEINRTQGTNLELKSLRGDDHTEACYRLTVTNLAHAIYNMSDESFRNLEEHWREHKDDLAIAIGGLNFRQRDGSQVLQKYAQEVLRARIEAYATGPKMRHYLSETREHFEQLHPERSWSDDPSVRPLFTYVGKNSKGLDVHRAVVEPGHTASKLSRVFDEYDKQVNGDRYKNTGYKNVVDVDGIPKKSLSPQDTVYVLGREH